MYFKTSLINISDSPTKFRLELGDVKDGNNHPKFNIFSTFMCGLLALPHSSACVERIFSQLNIIKTKDTNRLLVSSVANHLQAMQAIARQEGSCLYWEPSTSLFRDLKSGQCHKRYLKREDARKKEILATLHPGDTEASDDDDVDEPLQVFIQYFSREACVPCKGLVSLHQ